MFDILMVLGWIGGVGGTSHTSSHMVFDFRKRSAIVFSCITGLDGVKNFLMLSGFKAGID